MPTCGVQYIRVTNKNYLLERDNNIKPYHLWYESKPKMFPYP